MEPTKKIDHNTFINESLLRPNIIADVDRASPVVNAILRGDASEIHSHHTNGQRQWSGIRINEAEADEFSKLIKPDGNFGRLMSRSLEINSQQKTFIDVAYEANSILRITERINPKTNEKYENILLENKETLLTAEQQALQLWTTNLYKLFNSVSGNEEQYIHDFMEKNYIPIAEKENLIILTKKIIKTLTSAINKLPASINSLYRGAALTQAELKKYEEGRIVHEPKFLSFSTDLSIAKYVSRPTRQVGTKDNATQVMLYVESLQAKNIEPFSLYVDEKERIYEPGHAFKVKKISSNGTCLEIKLKEIDAKSISTSKEIFNKIESKDGFSISPIKCNYKDTWLNLKMTSSDAKKPSELIGPDSEFGSIVCEGARKLLEVEKNDRNIESTLNRVFKVIKGINPNTGNIYEDIKLNDENTLLCIEQQALHIYTSYLHMLLNAVSSGDEMLLEIFMRDNKITNDKKELLKKSTIDVGDALASAINKLPSYEGAIFRGTAMTKAELEEYEEGKLITGAKFLSFSTSISVVKEFVENTSYTKGINGEVSEPVVFIVLARQAKNIAEFSLLETENERIYLPGKQFKSLGRTKDVKLLKIFPNTVIILGEVNVSTKSS